MRGRGGPLWPDEFDTGALRRAGYSYREVREILPVWEASIPLHERKAAEAHVAAILDGVNTALDGFRCALGFDEGVEKNRLGVERASDGDLSGDA